MVPLLLIISAFRGEHAHRTGSQGVFVTAASPPKMLHIHVVPFREYHATMRWEGKGASLVLLLW